MSTKTIEKTRFLKTQKMCQTLRKNDLHRPGSWAALLAMVGRPKDHDNERPSKPLPESLCRWPANAILRLRKAGGTGFGCWGLGCGQVGTNQAPGSPKTIKKTIRQKLLKTLPNYKKRCHKLKNTKKVKTIKHVLVVFGRH